MSVDLTHLKILYAPSTIPRCSLVIMWIVMKAGSELRKQLKRDEEEVQSKPQISVSYYHGRQSRRRSMSISCLSVKYRPGDVSLA